VVEETPTEVPLDAIPGYDEETRLQYAGGLPEDTIEESLAEYARRNTNRRWACLARRRSLS
jgi:hypothetical protein